MFAKLKFLLKFWPTVEDILWKAIEHFSRTISKFIAPA